LILSGRFLQPFCVVRLGLGTPNCRGIHRGRKHVRQAGRELADNLDRRIDGFCILRIKSLAARGAIVFPE
jgi:hypothetical protein